MLVLKCAASRPLHVAHAERLAHRVMIVRTGARSIALVGL